MTWHIDTTQTSGGDFTPVPPGIHAARCVYIADIGTHAGAYGPRPLLLFVFEIPSLMAADGKPMQISRRFGKYFGDKSALRPFLQSWSGAPLAASLDLSKLAGHGGMLDVAQAAQGDRTFSNIQAIAPLQPGTTLPPPSVTPLSYGPDRNPATYTALPQWIQRLIVAGGAEPSGMAQPMPPPVAYPAGWQTPAPQTTTAPPAVDPAKPSEDPFGF